MATPRALVRYFSSSRLASPSTGGADRRNLTYDTTRQSSYVLADRILTDLASPASTEITSVTEADGCTATFSRKLVEKVAVSLALLAAVFFLPI